MSTYNTALEWLDKLMWQIKYVHLSSLNRNLRDIFTFCYIINGYIRSLVNLYSKQIVVKTTATVYTLFILKWFQFETFKDKPALQE